MNYDALLHAKLCASLHVFLRYSTTLIVRRGSPFVPRVGDLIVHNDERYVVEVVEWCLDSDAAPDRACRVNIEVTPASAQGATGGVP